MRSVKSFFGLNRTNLILRRNVTTKKKIPIPDEEEQLPSKYLNYYTIQNIHLLKCNYKKS